MSVRICNDKNLYNKFFKKEKLHFLQSWQWGEVKRPLWQPHRILVKDLPVSILERKIPFTNKSFGYIPKFLSELLISKQVISEVVHFVKDILKLSHLIIEPNSIELGQNSIFKALGFVNSGRSLQPNYTNIIELDSSYDQIFAKFSPTYRRNIRKSYKLGLEVEILDNNPEAVEKFFGVMSMIMKRTKYVMHGFAYFQNIWDKLAHDQMARIYLVRYDNEVLGALFVILDELGMYEMYGGVSDKGKQFRAGYVLRDVTIQDAISLGKKYYDQWGVAELDDEGNFKKTDELYGISLFKNGFGGKNVEFLPQYTKVFDSVGYKLYSVGKLFNSLKIKLEKLLK